MSLGELLRYKLTRTGVTACFTCLGHNGLEMGIAAQGRIALTPESQLQMMNALRQKHRLCAVYRLSFGAIPGENPARLPIL
jgi:hypothetical protein